RFLGMPPRIDSRRGLRQTSQKNRFTQCEITRLFSEIGARGCFRANPAVAVTIAIQILGKNPLLAPASLEFPGHERFVKFAAPTAPLPASRQFHELLRDCRSSGN